MKSEREIISCLKSVYFCSSAEAEKAKQILMKIYKPDDRYCFRMMWFEDKGITAIEFEEWLKEI